MSISLAAVVPSYNHYRHIGTVVGALTARGLRVFIIDDGSVEPAKSAISGLHDPKGGVTVHRRDENGGKGVAVMEGFRLAAADGFTHVLQIDADGQHDLNALPAIIEIARIHPNSLVSGEPVYDFTVPLSRKFGRWITHLWVWLETLSTEITDSMCGYRVYPLARTLEVMESEPVGHYMDFDTEIMVRLHWRGTRVRMLPVLVTYPRDNISNFRLGADNWLITKMHTRLVFGMLRRLPELLERRRRPGQEVRHWGQINERGVTLGLKILFTAYRVLGRRICWILAQPVLLYFFLTGSDHRRASRDYWRRIYAMTDEPGDVGLLQLWRHYRSFGRMALDRLAAWLGDIQLSDMNMDDIRRLDSLPPPEQGIVVITSHLGNVDVLRAVGAARGISKITVFVHTRNAAKFSEILNLANPGTRVNIQEVDDIGPATLIELQKKIDDGHWIVIAGDRIPLDKSKRIRMMNFLGTPAPFSEGAWLIASLLGAPVYSLLCVKEDGKFRVMFEKIADRIHRGRAADDGLAAPMGIYVEQLEQGCLRYPEQWYNFYDFWSLPEDHEIIAELEAKRQ
ncbi:glycosyltransferase family 2 protein [Sneathiella sp.]|uniref:glycosyltransferase family 2 protein n=1 Tax=Sneathiella sp. TaxID=1964365 RepID=UPI002FE3CF7A